MSGLSTALDSTIMQARGPAHPLPLPQPPYTKRYLHPKNTSDNAQMSTMNDKSRKDSHSHSPRKKPSTSKLEITKATERYVLDTI